LVAALEAVRCLHEDVIASASDGDVGAVLGIGYPVHRGGPFRHLRQQNLSALRGRLASLADRFGARYAAPDELAILEQLHAEPPRAVAR
jgi:3-hydroxyacyl-CoA dehydrogenase/enoyl-CoA hydratase/3-hydroxybutyryl-CoA epimerase